MGETTRLDPSICRRCGEKLDAATDTDGDARPTEGDVSICWSCGTVSFFTDLLALREPTVDEVRALLNDKQVNRVLHTLWSHHLAEVFAADHRVEFKCGCRTTAVGGLFAIESCAESCAAAQMVVRIAEESGKPLTVIR